MFSKLLNSTSRTLAIRSAVCHRKASGDFRVRRLAQPREIRNIIIEKAQIEGWRPGALDHVSYFAADNTGFFAGELDGEPICCISTVKYTIDFAFVGCYIVDESHRGKGYGLQTSKVALASLSKSCNLAADAVIEKVPVYGREGLKPYWEQQRYEFVASDMSNALADIHTDNIVSPSQQIFSSLFQYDTAVNTFQRCSFLKGWVFAPNCHCSVAIDNLGKVVGYGVVRSTLRKEDGWKIGPLFADNFAIARRIFKSMCDRVTTENPQAVLVIDIPYGLSFNEELLNIVTECNGRSLGTFLRLYKHGVPENMQLEKVFGITSLEIGC